MMKTMPPARPSCPTPQTAVDALDHLVTYHGWAPQPADRSLIQAHRHAHGLDGRHDLADAYLSHTHEMAPKSSDHFWAMVTIPGLLVFGLLMAGQGEVVNVIVGLFGLATVLGVYFVPTLVASDRKHHNIGAVAVVNIFLGWTLIGWVVALAMAATAVRPQQS